MDRNPGDFVSTAIMLRDKESILVSFSDGGLFLFNRFTGYQKKWNRDEIWRTCNAFHPEDPVTTVDPHPSQSDLFLAGYSSGTICLFSTHSSNPVWRYEPTFSTLKGRLDSIKQVAWSTTRASVFWVLKHSGDIAIWDLLQSRIEPQMISIRKDSVVLEVSRTLTARSRCAYIGLDSQLPGFECHRLLDNRTHIQMDEGVCFWDSLSC